MSIRVVLADDHQVVLDGLRRLLADEPDIEVVGDADDGRQAVDAARELKPDVVLLDVAMPNLNGIGAVKQILQESEDTKVLALSMHGSGQIVSDMLRAGAAGYVVKSCPIDEVVNAIRAVMEGKTYLSPEIAGDVVEGFVRGKGKDRRSSALSDREKEVLQLVAEGKSSKEIAAQLHVTVKTIEWHRKSIMDKLSIRSIAELTKYAVRQGLTTLEY